MFHVGKHLSLESISTIGSLITLNVSDTFIGVFHDLNSTPIRVLWQNIIGYFSEEYVLLRDQ